MSEPFCPGSTEKWGRGFFLSYYRKPEKKTWKILFQEISSAKKILLNQYYYGGIKQ